jgi:hypothetical protein
VAFLRRWLILAHRYLGIALSLVFVMWFVSGIAMIYARDMPSLTPEERLARRPAVDFSRVAVSPADAADGIGLLAPGRAVLLTIQDRPAYRFSGGESITVFADTGERMRRLGSADTLRIASRFLDLPERVLHYEGELATADQWTILQRGQLPLHKIRADDPARTALYISPRLGEVVVMTTRGSRALAWAAAIPHWLYFAPLRLNDVLWRRVVITLASLGIAAAFIGLVLAVIQFAPKRPFSLSRVGGYIPYSGWTRWHYLSGVVFGVFSLTWVTSGLLSLEPREWASAGGSGSGVYATLAGGPLEIGDFPPINAAAWAGVLPAGTIKEVNFVRIQGDPYYVVPDARRMPIVLRVAPLGVRRAPFPIESVLERMRDGNPQWPIVSSDLIAEYDAYYYTRGGDAPLPVLRVKFGDPDATWFYVDPVTSQPIASFTRRRRVERWVYHGFHSLDFAFWYDSRPLWDVGVIALALGGAALSLIGAIIGFKRLKRIARSAA